MYVDPFIAGVVSTLMAEVLLVVFVSIFSGNGKGGSAA